MYRLVAFVLFLLIPSVAPAQDQPTPTRPWTVDHILKQESLSQVDISPDGNAVLWVKRTPDFEKDRYTSDIFLTYVQDPFGSDEPVTIQLTRTGDNNRPRWSPDGKRIAFLSSRKPSGPEKKEETTGQQVWLMDARGGEPFVLTSFDTGVQGFAWLDSTHVLVQAREKKTQYEKTLKEKKDDVLVVEDTTLYFPSRLFKVHAASRQIERVSENDVPIIEFAPDPTGRYVVYSVDPSPVDADARQQPLQYLLDLHTGETTEIFDEQYLDPQRFRWMLDGSGFYAADEFASDPENEGAGIYELYYFDVGAMTHRKVSLDWPNGMGTGGYVVTRDGIHVQLADGPRMQARFYRKSGDTWSHSPVTDFRFRHSTSIEIGPDGETIVFDYSRADTIPRYYTAKYRSGTVSDAQELTSLNDYLKKLPIPKAEVIEWVGAEGDTVNGLLYYPLNYEPGRSYPLVVTIHGGPSGVDLDAWRLSWTVYPALFAQRGAFILRPNYHGSGHHGLEWVESIKGRYYELEVPDIVGGVEHLIDLGYAHPDSLGVLGWSNGAILTTALTVEHPTLFKVAAPGAGDVNWISDYGNCSFGVSFDDSYFGGPPWENVEHYIEKSPLFRLTEVVTPTLIHHGTEDRAVPTEQGWQYYRALQQIGKAPVRFILYPDQPHGLGRLSHQRRKVEEDLAWFDTYLFGTTSMEERLARRVLPESAPLARLQRRKQVAQVDGRYGVRLGGVLAPETITVNDTLQVGRFEVTRAQYRAFRSSYPVPEGTENYPASGISFEDAGAYVQWLSRRTGRTYRLPTEAEAKALRSLAGSSENNLAYWAGYAPNRDERLRLSAHLEAVSPAELLMEVGSRPPGNADDAGAPLIFDTDGNVAEWAVAEDGTGVVRSSSAVTVIDDRTPDAPLPPAAFTGLRVVLDE